MRGVDPHLDSLQIITFRNPLKAKTWLSGASSRSIAGSAGGSYGPRCRKSCRCVQRRDSPCQNGVLCCCRATLPAGQDIALGIKQPAMERAAGRLIPVSITQVGTSVRAMPVDQPSRPSPSRNSTRSSPKMRTGTTGLFTGQLIGEGDRLPVTAHQCAARCAIIGLGQLSVYLEGKHDASCHHENKSVFLPGARFRRQIAAARYKLYQLLTALQLPRHFDMPADMVGIS